MNSYKIFVFRLTISASRFITVLSILAIIVLISSCKKFLEEKPDKRAVELRTLEDLQALLDDNAQMNSNTPGFGETSSDDYFVLQDSYNSYLEIFKRAYTWRADDYSFLNDWAYSYNAIYNANYCLDYIKNISRTNQNTLLYDNVMGSSYFHRAFRYLLLIWEYGKAFDESTSQTDLGIVLRLTPDPSEPSVRATVKECYERILSDAKEASKYLPPHPQHVMRPSKASAFGLIARTYLSMRNYDSAFKYADLCLQIKSDLLDFNDGSQVSTDPANLTPFLPFNPEIIFFSTMSGNYVPKTTFEGLVDTTLYNSYSSDDLRKSVYFYPHNGYYTFKGNYNASSIFDQFTGLATDEIYLIRAECHARAQQPRLNEAMNDLNSILEKRWSTGTFTPVDASDPQEALQLILMERRKELIMRGLRWFDVKRLNKENQNISFTRMVDQVYSLPPNDNKFALPLPRDILELTGMPQNPGW